MTVSNGKDLDVIPNLQTLADHYLEPGYYADGRFGIRIENVVVVQEADTPNNFGNKGFLRFEHLTMVGALNVGCLGS